MTDVVVGGTRSAAKQVARSHEETISEGEQIEGEHFDRALILVGVNDDYVRRVVCPAAEEVFYE
jgi:hypothetical protein